MDALNTDDIETVLLPLASSVSRFLRALSHFRAAEQRASSSILERSPRCAVVVLICSIRLPLCNCNSPCQHYRNIAAAVVLVCSRQHVPCSPTLWTHGHSLILRHFSSCELSACCIRFRCRLGCGHVSVLAVRIYRKLFQHPPRIGTNRVKLVNSYATVSGLTAELDGVTFGLNIIFPVGNLFVRYPRIVRFD